MSSRKKSRFGGKAALLTVILTAVIGVSVLLQVSPLFVKLQGRSLVLARADPKTLGNGDFAPPSVNLPPMNLTLVALNGTQLILNDTDIGHLPSFESEGGFKTSGGSLSGISNYTGVAVSTLLALVGGIDSNCSLRISAADGYSMVYTYNQIQGENYTTYSPATGEEVTTDQPFTTVLAYYKNRANLTYDDGGPLRFAILGPQALLTDGHLWIKWVTMMEIRPSVEDWTLALKGALVENMTRDTFESGVNCIQHSANWTDSNDNVWTGLPLWLLAGRVDDGDVHTTNSSMRAFNDTLALQGYTIKIVTGQGYSVELNSTDPRFFRSDKIILADRLNGAPLQAGFWPLRLVGSGLSGSEMLVNVVQIDLEFNSPSVPEFPSLIILALFMIATLLLAMTCRTGRLSKARSLISQRKVVETSSFLTRS